MLPRHDRNAAKFSGQSMPATNLDAMVLRQPSLRVATCSVAVGRHWVERRHWSCPYHPRKWVGRLECERPLGSLLPSIPSSRRHPSEEGIGEARHQDYRNCQTSDVGKHAGLNRNRRLAEDFEATTESSVTWPNSSWFAGARNHLCRTRFRMLTRPNVGEHDNYLDSLPGQSRRYSLKPAAPILF